MTIDFANNALRRGRAECDQRLERVKGIEPSYSAWKAAAKAHTAEQNRT
jgi:hypothetical protein